MRSLTWKLTFVVLSVSLLSVMIVFLLTRWITVREFDRLVSAQARADFIERVTTYYQQAGQWQGVMAALPTTGQPPNSRNPRPGPPLNHRQAPFALLDQQGCVVVPAGPYALGDCPQPLLRERQDALVIDDQVVGAIVTVREGAGLSPLEEAYLLRTNRALRLSAMGAAVLAVVLGLIVARTLTRPLQTLTTAIRAMTAGELGQQVPVQSQDELGELARAFNKMSTDLAQATRARRQMTADIAHELRNPLMVMIGYLEAMRDGVLQPTGERLATLYDEAHHLQHLVADLRTLSLADAGELPLQREAVSPQELLLRVYNGWQPQAQQHQVSLEYQTDADLPAIRVDPERMIQVFNNLVSNALRYTQVGGQIVLAARREGDSLLLTVADNGAGIAADHLPLIFDRFYRADPARSERSGESGLGLAIARSIVEAHGGALSVASAGLGQGTTFTMTLALPPA
ncbi:MAG: ATP-binding protein [Caldilineaceae bacterium]